VPDAPGLELIRGEIEQDHPGAVLDTGFEHGAASLAIDPAQVLAVLTWLRDAPGQGYRFLSSLHAADYLPAQPRFAVHYELLNRDRVERIRVKALLNDPTSSAGGADSGGPRTEAQPPPAGPPEVATGPAAERMVLPEIDSCVELFPTAEFQEREVFDFFGIVFKGHPELTRILLPDDYIGWPQRRDFPVGGEPVTFTYNEHNYG
jgi:NADH-quinone oxidoreductase subunit C